MCKHCFLIVFSFFLFLFFNILHIFYPLFINEITHCMRSNSFLCSLTSCLSMDLLSFLTLFFINKKLTVICSPQLHYGHFLYLPFLSLDLHFFTLFLINENIHSYSISVLIFYLSRLSILLLIN